MEFEHLEPLLAAYCSTAVRDPRRGDLRNQLVAGYLPVARRIATRYAGRGEPLDDLVQVASLGLFLAVERYQPDTGHHFLAFAVPTITGEVRRHFRDRTWSMRVARRIKDLRVEINNAVAELSQRQGRAPRPSEIASRLGVSTDEVLEALQAADAYRAESLDEMLTADAHTGPRQDIPGGTDPGLELFINTHTLAPHLAALPSRDRAILIMRFYEEMTQFQIAKKIGISQMHVSRILTKTLDRLREKLTQDDSPPQPPPSR